MSEQSEYIEFLLQNSLEGRKNSFGELSEFFYKEIYQFIFPLIKNSEKSKSITVDVFFAAWQNLKQIPLDVPFISTLKKLAVIKSLYYLKAHEYDRLKSDFDLSKLNEFEKRILQLDDRDRLVLLEISKTNFSEEDIRKSAGLIEEEDIKSFVAFLKYNLFVDLGYNISDNIPIDEWLLIDGREKKEDYKYSHAVNIFEESLKNAFTEIDVSEGILVELKDALLEESYEIIKKKNEEISEKEKLSNAKEKEFNIQSNNFIKNGIGNASLFSNLDIGFSPEIEEKSANYKYIYISVAALLILIIGFYTFNYFANINTPWSIESTRGAYSVNEKNDINEINELNDGDKLIVNPRSSVSFIVGNLAEIEIGESSSFKVVKGSNSDNVVELDFGQLTFISFTDYKNLTEFSETPNFTIRNDFFRLLTEHSTFRVKINNNGNLKIQQKEGWSELFYNNEKLYFSPNYNFSLGFLTPFHKNTDKRLITILRDPANLKLTSNVLNQILNLVESTDLLILFHLFYKVDKNERVKILTKIAKLLPLDNSIDTNRILNLDEEVMKDLLDMIKWKLLK